MKHELFMLANLAVMATALSSGNAWAQPSGGGPPDLVPIEVTGDINATVTNDESNPVPVTGEVNATIANTNAIPVLTDPALEREPFLFYGTEDEVGLRSCVVAFNAPQGLVIESIGVTGRNFRTGVNPRATVSITTQGTTGSFRIPLLPTGNFGNDASAVLSLRLYPDAYTQVDTVTFGEDVTFCEVFVSGYTLVNSKSLSP